MTKSFNRSIGWYVMTSPTGHVSLTVRDRKLWSTKIFNNNPQEIPKHDKYFKRLRPYLNRLILMTSPTGHISLMVRDKKLLMFNRPLECNHAIYFCVVIWRTASYDCSSSSSSSSSSSCWGKNYYLYPTSFMCLRKVQKVLTYKNNY